VLADLLIGARFLVSLRGFLRHPIALAEAELMLRHRLEERESGFLTLVQRAIYGHPGSVYRRLLEAAGCEYGDLERLVRKDGVEGALRTLYRGGVYATVEELKGRVPIVRGGVTIGGGSPSAFWNPLSTVHAFLQTGGSRGSGTPVPLDLASIRESAATFRLVLHARGGADWHHALWWVPGGMALNRLLTLGAIGTQTVRWFSQVDVSATALHPRYRWSDRLARWGARLSGVTFPRAEHVPLSDPMPIARWMADTLRAGAVPNQSTFPGGAVVLAEAAVAAGLDVRGTCFSLVGEPLTPARLARLEALGARVFNGYASVESGGIAWGCLRAQSPDDSHVQQDRHALIQPADVGNGGPLPPSTLLLTSLWSTAPLILLNASLGDEGTLVQRQCGCAFEQLGWTTHLHHIRSFEKLTAASMNLLDHDLVRVLEEVLPGRFGGGPMHYQLIEEEEDGGAPRLRLLVHPDVGALDTSAVAQAFLAAIGPGRGPEYLTRVVWKNAGILTVERRPPLSTPSGKILHVIARRDRP
jgi:hypothetical protein